MVILLHLVVLLPYLVAALTSLANCYADNIPGRTMTGAFTSTNYLTPQNCAAYCKRKGFAWSGTEYAKECYCANAPPTQRSNNCNMACSGDSQQVCGGPNALNVLGPSSSSTTSATSKLTATTTLSTSVTHASTTTSQTQAFSVKSSTSTSVPSTSPSPSSSSLRSSLTTASSSASHLSTSSTVLTSSSASSSSLRLSSSSVSSTQSSSIVSQRSLSASSTVLTSSSASSSSMRVSLSSVSSIQSSSIVSQRSLSASSMSGSSWPSSTPKNVPLRGSVVDYGSTTDPNFNIYRDGGGGVSVNGQHLMMFSDSFTTNGNASASMTSFEANTFAYANTVPGAPKILQDFGSNGIPQLEIATAANETYQGNGRYAVWPSQSMIPYGANTAIGVVPVILNLQKDSSITYVYNTLVQVTLGSTPSATRLVQSLFYGNEIPFGSFGILAGPDGYTYLFGADKSGMKAARVTTSPSSAITNRALYQYYNAGKWSSTIPQSNDATSNVFNYTASYFGSVVGLYSGEMYFSKYHNTYVLIFMDGWVDGAFQISYSTTGLLVGPWSAPTTIYSPATAPSGNWNYAGHAYPMMDPTGQTLELTYTYNNLYINVAKITFCDGSSSACSTSASTTPNKRNIGDFDYAQFLANNGPCRIKFPSGCNIIPEAIDYKTNAILKARLSFTKVGPPRDFSKRASNIAY